jgi:hypothetical protein
MHLCYSELPTVGLSNKDKYISLDSNDDKISENNVDSKDDRGETQAELNQKVDTHNDLANVDQVVEDAGKQDQDAINPDDAREEELNANKQ